MSGGLARCVHYAPRHCSSTSQLNSTFRRRPHDVGRDLLPRAAQRQGVTCLGVTGPPIVMGGQEVGPARHRLTGRRCKKENTVDRVDTLTVRRLVLLDSNGRERGELACTDDGLAQLALRDEHGTVRAVLAVPAVEPSLSMITETLTPRKLV